MATLAEIQAALLATALKLSETGAIEFRSGQDQGKFDSVEDLLEALGKTVDPSVVAGATGGALGESGGDAPCPFQPV
jgi:hypothetical protein